MRGSTIHDKEAEEEGKAVIDRVECIPFPQMPFTDNPGRITRLLEQFGDRDFILVQNGMDLLDVASLCDSHRIATGHQCRPRWPTNRLSVEARELHTLPRHRIKPRSADVGRSETADVLVTLVVGENDDEIGLPRPGFAGDRDVQA